MKMELNNTLLKAGFKLSLNLTEFMYIFLKKLNHLSEKIEIVY